MVEEFAHVAGTGTGGGLVGHRGDPFDVSGFKEGADGHEHEADGAVAAYEVFLTAVEGGIDDGLVTGSRMMVALSAEGWMQRRSSAVQPVARSWGWMDSCSCRLGR